MPGTLQWPGFDRPATFGLWSERESEQAALGRGGVNAGQVLRTPESGVSSVSWCYIVGFCSGYRGFFGVVLGSI